MEFVVGYFLFLHLKSSEEGAPGGGGHVKSKYAGTVGGKPFTCDFQGDEEKLEAEGWGGVLQLLKKGSGQPSV